MLPLLAIVEMLIQSEDPSEPTASACSYQETSFKHKQI